MSTWASSSPEQPTVFMEVEEEPTESGPDTDLLVGCPMCRAFTMVTPSTSRRDELKTKYPIASAEREAEATYESHNGSDGAEGGESVQTIIINIKNSPERDAEENTPQAWTFFVRPSRTDAFENVYLILYPTSEQYPVTVIQKIPPTTESHASPGEASASMWYCSSRTNILGYQRMRRTRVCSR